jgi:N-formylglutamate amidohydrolase
MVEQISQEDPPFFAVIDPEGPLLPILISIPHAGTVIPEEDKGLFQASILANLEDTDWALDELYNFAPKMGITVIQANLSRYVIDLNRNPAGERLYADARIETGIVPTQTFSGLPVYENFEPTPEFIHARTKKYFDPYYEKIGSILIELRNTFKQVLFFDAHSIVRILPRFPSTPFPDLMLGDREGKSAAPEISALAQAELRRQAIYEVTYNYPFKGGNLTRHWGKPSYGVHSLQLEMCQDLYLNEATKRLNPEKAEKLQLALRSLFLALAKHLAGES